MRQTEPSTHIPPCKAHQTGINQQSSCFVFFQKDNGNKAASRCQILAACDKSYLETSENPPRCEINIISTSSRRRKKNKKQNNNKKKQNTKGKFHATLPLDWSRAVLMKPDEAPTRKRGRKDSISLRCVPRYDPPTPHTQTLHLLQSNLSE